MKIVVLDGYTLNPGDLSWEELGKLGEVTIYDRTSPDAIISRCLDADVVLTNKTPLSAKVIAQLPLLKYIGVLATGYNVVDTTAAKEKAIVVTNVPGYGTASVVQLTFALLLELCFYAYKHSEAVRAGKWSASPDFCFWDAPLTELQGKTMGIVGFGDIGRKIADVATAFGMNLLCYSRTASDQSHRKNFGWADFTTLLQQSDVVSIHCPLTNETTGLINKAALEKMKPTAFLLNTSRGQIVIDDDLANALNQGTIAGAGIDVLSIEPPRPGNPLFTAKNCIITPHIAWATKEARQRLMNGVVENLASFIQGAPINVVNKQHLRLNTLF